MNLAIIPARGGSKRIPRKNIRSFCGRPIIAYSIAAARDSGCFDEIMVSTDDTEIAEVARAQGAQVPFLRSAAASNDQATTAEVLVEVLEAYGRLARMPVLACCLYPTAPFVTPENLRAGHDLLKKQPTLESALPIVRFSFPIQRALRQRDGKVSFFQPEHALTRSQDLEPAYHDAGQFYWLRVEPFLRSRRLLTGATAGIVLPEWQVQDIDNEDDWIAAEMKFRQLAVRQPVP